MQLGLFVLLLMVMMKKGLMLLLMMMMMIANSFCTRIYSIIADANKRTWLIL
jgi:hypothetical protein